MKFGAARDESGLTSDFAALLLALLAALLLVFLTALLALRRTADLRGVGLTRSVLM